MEPLDYRRLFESAPGLAVVLDRDLRVVAASDAFLKATLTKREAIVGRDAFEVFPGDEERGGGEAIVRELLGRVLAEGKPRRLALQRYDVARPAEKGGGLERRYWRGGGGRARPAGGGGGGGGGLAPGGP